MKTSPVSPHRSTTNATAAAYAAGLVDGEGCIWISRKGLAYSAMVQVGMTLKAKPMLERMQREWGGSLNKTREATDRWASAWMWDLAGTAAEPFLRAVLPHLRMKAEQARLALTVQAIRTSLLNGRTKAYWTKEAAEKAALLKARCQELNRRGPTAPGTIPDILALRVGGQWLLVQAELFDAMPSERSSLRWPLSGTMFNGVASMHSSSASPNAASVCSLSAILEPRVPPKYYLSPKACAGILRRAAKRGRELPPALLAALSAASAEETTPEHRKARPS